MKNYLNFIAPPIVAFYVTANAVKAQSFQNLDFESATLTPEQGYQPWPNLVPISEALPGWTAYLGNVQQTDVGQNTYANSLATVDVLGPGFGTQPGPFGEGLGIIDGNYSVLLQGGITPDSPESVYVSASIGQTGTVPVGAESLTFRAWDIYANLALFTVSFDGSVLSPTFLSTGISPSGQQYNVYGVNVAPYAGQTGQLEFAAEASAAEPTVLLDDIQFSPNAIVPEPNSLTLAALGGLAFFLLRKARN